VRANKLALVPRQSMRAGRADLAMMVDLPFVDPGGANPTAL